jgi:hypothetical protein
MLLALTINKPEQNITLWPTQAKHAQHRCPRRWLSQLHKRLLPSFFNPITSDILTGPKGGRSGCPGPRFLRRLLPRRRDYTGWVPATHEEAGLLRCRSQPLLGRGGSMAENERRTNLRRSACK